MDTIKTFGYGYLVGDAAMMTAGILKAGHDAQAQGVALTDTQRFKEAAVGGIYATAGIVGARYGNPSAEKKLELFYNDMRRDLTRMGIEIPKDTTPELLAKHDGAIDRIEAFLYRHPTQVIHAIFAAGGVQGMLAGLPKGQSAFNPHTFTGGLLVTIGGLTGLLLPEKKPDPHHPPQGWGEKVMAKIQEKPLATAAAIFTANNAFLFTGAFADRKQYMHGTGGAQHSWMFTLVTAAAYITSNYFLSRSKRENTGAQGEDEKEMLDHLRKTSAALVRAQPPEMQVQVLHQVAGYLATRKEVGLSAAELTQQLQAGLAELAPQARPVMAAELDWKDRIAPPAAQGEIAPR